MSPFIFTSFVTSYYFENDLRRLLFKYLLSQLAEACYAFRCPRDQSHTRECVPVEHYLHLI